MNQSDKTEKKNDITRRKFLKWGTGGLVGAAGLALGLLRPWRNTVRGVTLSQTLPRMGTSVEITARGKGKEELSSLIGKAYQDITEVDRTMSVFKKESLVHQLNQGGKKKIPLTTELEEVIKEGERISRLTGGSFDITAAPLLDLWGFYDGKLNVPSPTELEETLKLVDHRQVELNSSLGTLTLTQSEAGIDLGGIAKGYGVDRAIETLKDGGATAGLVNAGGDIRGFGSPKDHNNWRVGLQNPLVKDDLLCEVDLLLSSVTTSGNYESFFTYQGSKLAHILDPRTGRPVQDVMSVSILTESAVKADALSTGLFCQGAQEALDTVEKLEDTELIYIRKNDLGEISVVTTEGLKNRIDNRKLERTLNSTV